MAYILIMILSVICGVLLIMNTVLTHKFHVLAEKLDILAMAFLYHVSKTAEILSENDASTSSEESSADPNSAELHNILAHIDSYK